MRVIVVEDEKLARSYLEKMLHNIVGVELIGKYKNPAQAVEVILQEELDVVFLAVELDNISGIDLAEQIQNDLPSTHIVFMSSSNEHAVKAFELGALDFLPKPITRKRLMKTVRRAREKIGNVYFA